MKILFLPSWYPSKYNPVKGIFIKEHAKAVSLFNDVVVLYLEYDGYHYCPIKIFDNLDF